MWIDWGYKAKIMLFEGEGALDDVMRHAARWFLRLLPSRVGIH
jgi:hypothetical protein